MRNSTIHNKYLFELYDLLSFIIYEEHIAHPLLIQLFIKIMKYNLFFNVIVGISNKFHYIEQNIIIPSINNG